MADDPIFDDDNPEWTREDFARARSFDSLPPHVRAAFPNGTGSASTASVSPIGRAVVAQSIGARLSSLAA